MAEPPPPKSLIARGWRTAAATMLAAILLLVLVAWVQRRPLIERFVDRELRARGVPGRYRIEAIGLTEQRLSGVVLGDPARPDLTARSVVLGMAWGPTGPYLAAVTARGVRLAARLADGRLSLGAVDRLLPAPSGAPFALPEIMVDVDDMAVALVTPAGNATLAIAGQGRLDGGFRGRIGFVAPVLRPGDCEIATLAGDLGVAVRQDGIALTGPVRAASLDCRGARVAAPSADLQALLARALDGWSGTARLAAAGAMASEARFGTLAGTMRFAGVPERTDGSARLRGSGEALGLVAPAIAVDARFASGPRAIAEGVMRMDRVRYPLAPRLAALDAVAGTPLEPLSAALRRSLTAASRDFSATARFRYADGLAVDRVTLASRSGIRAQFTGRAEAMEGNLRLSGGGLPGLSARFAGDEALVTVAPFAAADARLALSPIRVAKIGGEVRIATRASLDGPVAGGRVTGLAAPIAARVGPTGAALEGGCLPVGIGRLEIAGFDFHDARLAACPIPGGVTIASLALAGRSGESPATVAAKGVRYAAGRFAMGPVSAAIGPEERRSRLDLATLDGTAAPDGLAGNFTGATGSIAAVPILASEGRGTWTLAGGRLAVDGAVRVADAAAEPRFFPLVARDLRLALQDGRILATGTLREPAGGVAVTTATIRHDLGAGSGDAVLAVPELRFGDALQPERLTRLTLGVIANVQGAVSGEGRIRWTPDAVTSDGDFTTTGDGIDLAAAFGPVSGIKGRVHFSDLLALATPPGQQATIAEANPGVAVADGTVRYQLLPEQRVRIEGGRWPFAGGQLLLQPETIDFARTERRLAFTVDGLDAARFVQQLGFENIAATGTFDGVMPMVFDDAGGRVAGGRLVARDGGGTLAYVGELTQAQLGTFGKLAFDALKSIRYRNLTILLDGALDGEIVSRVSFAGVNQEPLEGMKMPFRQQLKGLPFVFNITVRAPFRGLIGSARAFADPTLFIRERLAAPPLPGQGPPVQPADSGEKP